jgi:hypothetical protein
MTLAVRLVLCTLALFVMASSLAQASDPIAIAADQQFEDPTGMCTDCDAAGPYAGAPLSVFVPDLTPGIQFSASFLQLKPGADNLGWSTITTYLPVQNPQWDVQNLNPAYQPGFSVGARYVIPSSGKDIQTNWEHLRTSDSSSVAVSDPTTQWISPFNQTGPSASEFYNQIGIFYLKWAEAQVNFAYDMVNIDAGQTVNFGAYTQVRLFAGLSWVRLQQQLVSTFYNDTSINPAPPAFAIPDPALHYITLNNTTSYSGAGPRLGLTAAQNVCGGLTLVGQLSGAVLAGSMQPAQYVFQGVFENNIDAEAITSRRVNQVVYATDAKLGLGYNGLLGNRFPVRIESGFKAALFVNPFATYETSTNVLPLNIGSLSTNSMRHTPSNFTLNGWYATASVQW